VADELLRRLPQTERASAPPHPLDRITPTPLFYRAMGLMASEGNEVFESAFSSPKSSRRSSYSSAEEATPIVLLFPQFDPESVSLPFHSMIHLSACSPHMSREEPDTSTSAGTDMLLAHNAKVAAASSAGTMSAEPAPSPPGQRTQTPRNPRASPPLVPILKTSSCVSENAARKRSVTFAETEQVRAISRRRRALRFRSTLCRCRRALTRWFWV